MPPDPAPSSGKGPLGLADRLLGRVEGAMLAAASAIVALLVVSLLLTPTWEHAQRSIMLGDSTMDLHLPMWPSKLLVPAALAVLWLRLLLNALGYLRLIVWPRAEPVAVPVPGHVVGDIAD